MPSNLEKVLSEHSDKKKRKEIGNVDIPFGANPYTSLNSVLVKRKVQKNNF